jgi:glycerol-3-phosphate acyltransferase PlsY
MDLPTAVLVSLLAYVIGSIPTGAIIARLYGHIDLTKTGSERTGATNALRTMGIGAGVIVLLGDFAKGALAVFLARQLTPDALGLGLAAFFSVVGHNRSMFLRGKGGRGVVTGLGGLIAINPLLFLVAAVSGCIVVAVTRYVSLGSIIGAALAMVAAIIAVFAGAIETVVGLYVVITGGLVIAAHSDNIQRLRARTERRLGGDRPPRQRRPHSQVRASRPLQSNSAPTRPDPEPRTNPSALSQRDDQPRRLS